MIIFSGSLPFLPRKYGDWLAIYKETSVSGVKGSVDVNIYNGDLQQLVTGVVVFSSSIQ
jgi:hypothetical protein